MSPDLRSSGQTVLNPALRYHFLGIGGVGMSAVAEVLHRRGFQISGSDAADSETLRRLGEIGIAVAVGHQPSLLDAADAVVFTTALDEDHPIWPEVRGRGLPSLHRSEMLGALTRQGRALAVAGTHGKTTSTACLAAVLEGAGLDPTALVGGHVPQFGGSNLRMGNSPWLVVEADESDGSFARLSPWGVLLTNIDADHLDRHGSLGKVVEAFGAFLARLEDGHPLVYCLDDPNIAPLLKNGRWRTCSYGINAGADVRVHGVEPDGEGMRMRLTRQGREHALRCRVAGAHNALNLAGVFALAVEAGVAEEDALRGLEQFAGVERRQQYLGTAFGCRIFDDYAHHPTEIRATLGMFREHHGDELTVVFQPHLYSRTAFFAKDFAEALRPARRIYVTDIYGAREAPLDGVSSRLILEQLEDHGAAAYVADWRDMLSVARSGALAPGVLVTMGAGDITGLGPLLLQHGGTA